MSALQKISTKKLVKEHGQLNHHIDRPGPEVRRLQAMTSVPRPAFMCGGVSFSRAEIKDELVLRARQGDVVALGYAAERNWGIYVSAAGLDASRAA